MLGTTPCPVDLRVVLHHSHSESYERSAVLLARASADGSLQLLTRGWERTLGYLPHELDHMTLMQLMEFDPRSAAAAVEAILDERDLRPLGVRLRCGNGLAKGFKLHRHYDRQVHTMYILAEETPLVPSALMRENERRFGERRARA
jgi:hypothetical protein